ncbi:hypothetical protein B9K06_23735 [Bacillus sp. OG2]|nr:hypothetical protein B9K06_23735 [Bacillus sp. OG2]
MAYQPKSYRKFLAGSVSAAVVASALAAPAGAAAASASFPDVPTGHWAYNEITALADKGIINGYSDGSFKPSQLLNRGQAAVLFTNALGLEVPENLNVFKDLKATSYFAQYAAAVEANGVFGGYANGNFGAGDNLTREQMASVLVRAFDLKDNGEAVNVADLSKAHASHQANVKILVQNGVSVVSDNNFRPKETVSRAQFATFLYRAMVLTGKINENADVVSVKAINATTVEVKMADEVSADVKAADFTIDGLTVSNAVVKQTDKNTVVLTTSAQEGKEYTLKIKGETAGKFTGVSAVIPSKINLVSKSVQGKLGQEVTVTAKVEVADGQSKAGIPVTFNVPGNNGTLYETITKEAVTNENGEATFTYTRYAATTDTVTAYATGDRSKFSTGYVFWGVNQILTVEEVTEGSTINNGANKTYKVKLTNPSTGSAAANKTLNVSFVENLNVTADKVKNASVNGVQPVQLSNGTAPVAAQITTDSKGEATFTVSGTNTEVTPIVFEANNTVSSSGTIVRDFGYSASDLQAVAPKVTFSALQVAYTIDITRDGSEEAARYASNGRKYNVVVKDKDGKVAANEVVNVAFNEDLDRVISTTTEAKFVEVLSNGNQQYFTGDKAKQITVKTNSKGEASFVVSSDKLNDYATPVAWIDINTPNAVEGKLDEGEPKTVAPISYFADEVLDGAALKVYNGTKETDKFKGTETATFSASLVNQSGKTVGSTIKKVSYTVYNTGSNDVKVGNQVVSPNRSYTVTYDTSSATTDLKVSPVSDKNASVKVVATGIATDTDGTDYAFTAKEATATFTSTQAVADTYTSYVSSINTTDKEITFTGKSPVSYEDATFKAENGSTITLEAFEALVNANLDDILLTYTKTTDDKVTFEVVSISTRSPLSLAVTTPGAPVLTSSASYTVEGTATGNSTVKVYTDLNNDGIVNGSDAVVATGTATGGNYSIATPLTANSANNFVVVAYDAVGNYSATVDVATITHDGVAPAAAVSPTAPAGLATITGAASSVEAGSTVKVFDAATGGTEVGGSDVVNANGSFTWTSTDPLTANTNYFVEVIDAAGNKSATRTQVTTPAS